MAGIALPAVAAGVALGILAADAGLAPSVALTFAAGIALALVSWAFPGGGRVARLVRATGVALLGVGLGVSRGTATALPTGPDSVIAHIGPTGWQVRGTVVDDPRPRGERQQAILDELGLASDGTAPQPVRGRVLVWLPRAASVQAGDRLALVARLEAPRDFDGFAYGAYLARQGIGAVASAYAANVVSHRRAAVADGLGGLRGWLLAGLNSIVPEPEAALAAGVLLGVRASIAPEVNDAFARAGLTHVVAISGWNIAIVAALAAASARPLTRLRGGRMAAILLAGSTVGGYVLLTGASPSVVRAALMAGGL